MKKYSLNLALISFVFLTVSQATAQFIGSRTIELSSWMTIVDLILLSEKQLETHIDTQSKFKDSVNKFF